MVLVNRGSAVSCLGQFFFAYTENYHLRATFDETLSQMMYMCEQPSLQAFIDRKQNLQNLQSQLRMSFLNKKWRQMDGNLYVTLLLDLDVLMQT